MKRRATIALVVAACGGSQQRPAQPITNVTKPGSMDAESSSGPGHARVIQRTSGGGVVELEGGDRDAAFEDAFHAMEDHCGKGAYTVVQEGEEAIGTDAATGRAGTAWRVHYQCTPQN